MSKIIIFIGIYLLGVFVSAVAQILLKKSAMKSHSNIFKEYLNMKTIMAYSMLLSATFCTVIAYKYVPLSMGPLLGTLEYIFVAVLGYFFLKEKINRKKLLGLIIILFGIIVYSL